MADKQKTLASRRGSLGFQWSSRWSALVPRPTVPPGAGNEAKKAGKTEPKRVEKGAEGYVETVVDGHLDASTVRRHDDGDSPAIPTIQIEQHGLRVARSDGPSGPRCSGSLAGIVDASTAPHGPVPCRDRCRNGSSRAAAFTATE